MRKHGKRDTRILSVSSDIHRNYSLCYRPIKGGAMNINLNNANEPDNLSV